MPESVAHDEAVELLKAILAFWARDRPNTRIARNLAIRWDQSNPSIGVDPDVCVLSPAPREPSAEVPDLSSVRTWLPGNSPPVLAIEVVSANNPRKDYVVAPEKYAASGTQELWVFDPFLSGPRSHGGPFKLQVWERDENDDFVRIYAGDGPTFSRMMSAHVVPMNRERKLRIASDPGGENLWLTAEEAERKEAAAARAAQNAALADAEAARAAKNAALADAEAERTAKEAALAELALLRAAQRTP